MNKENIMDYSPQKYNLIAKLSETKLDYKLSPLYIEQMEMYVQEYNSEDECWQYFINPGTDCLLKSNRRLVTRKYEKIGHGFKLTHYFSPIYSICEEKEILSISFHIKKDFHKCKMSNGKYLIVCY